MKHFFTLLAAMFMAIAASAQSVTWCPPGAEWHYSAGAFSTSGFVHMKYDSDTIIDGQACKKLVEHMKVVEQQFGNIYDTYNSYFTYEDNGVVYGYGRHDDFANNITTYSWDTLYNFNALPGNEWRLFNRYDEHSKIIVQATGSRLIQGMQLRWLAIDFGDDFGYPADTIYERIGHIGYNYPFIPSVLSTDPHIYDLCNYSDNEITDWRSTDANCRVLPPVSRPEELNPFPITAFPNPAADNLITLRLPGGANGSVEVELLDIFGRKVVGQQQYKTADAGIEVDFPLSGVAPGIYFLKASQRDKASVVKIIRQ